MPAVTSTSWQTEIPPEVALMKIRIRSASLALLTASVIAIGLATNAQAAAAPSTPVHLSAAQVARHCSWPATSPA